MRRFSSRFVQEGEKGIEKGTGARKKAKKKGTRDLAGYFRLLQLAASGWLGGLAVLAVRSSRAVVVDFLFGRPKTGLSPISVV